MGKQKFWTLLTDTQKSNLGNSGPCFWMAKKTLEEF